MEIADYSDISDTSHLCTLDNKLLIWQTRTQCQKICRRCSILEENHFSVVHNFPKNRHPFLNRNFFEMVQIFPKYRHPFLFIHCEYSFKNRTLNEFYRYCDYLLNQTNEKHRTNVWVSMLSVQCTPTTL